jgi:hypothetical protein
MTGDPPALPSPSGNRPSVVREEPKERIPRPDARRRELALAFCRECLGWPEATAVSDHRSFHIVENRPRPELSHAYGKSRGFQLDPGDLGHVLNAVRNWCDTHAAALSLNYTPGSMKDFWRARMAPYAEAAGDDPCDVLLRACLAGNRNVAERSKRAVAGDAATQIRNPAGLTAISSEFREQADTALAFCREYMGWKGAYIVNDWGHVSIKENVPRHLAATPIPPWERHFHFDENHVDTVLEKVRTWCDARAVALALEYFPSGSAKDCWHASLPPHADAHSEGACAALLSACLAAHRKLALPESPPCPLLP